MYCLLLRSMLLTILTADYCTCGERFVYCALGVLFYTTDLVVPGFSLDTRPPANIFTTARTIYTAYFLSRLISKYCHIIVAAGAVSIRLHKKFK